MAQDQAFDGWLVEVVGGMIGGRWGGSLPDRLDPPTSPNHRSGGHGVITAGGALIWAWRHLPEWQEALRGKADEFRSAGESDFTRLCYRLLAWLCHVAAGALAGLTAGYTSHLAMDATTRQGLPAFVAGF